MCGWLGVGMLLPWNFYYNASSYWMFKFRSVSVPLNETLPDFNTMQTFWNTNLSLVSMAPNFTFLFLNVLIGHRIGIQLRLNLALVANILLFILSLVFTQVNTDSWQTGFYWLTLAFAMLFNVMDSVFQGAFASLLGRFPPEYMSSLANGQAIGGTLASAASVIFLALPNSNQVDVALFSFTLASIFLFSAVVLLFYVSKQPFYRHFYPEESKEGSGGGGSPSSSELPLVLRSTWQFLLAVFLNFFVTLGVFPSLFALAKSTEDEDSTWAKFFVPVGGFLVFNLCDLLGRLLAGAVRWPGATSQGAWVTLGFSVLRLVFVPLFIFCNINPSDRVNSKVLFHSDLVFFFINLAFSLSNGYITNICMMCTPKMVTEPRHQSMAASLTVFLLCGGLLAGSGASFLWVKLL